MAYTIKITKQKVEKLKNGYMVSVIAVFNDGQEDVLQKTFSKRHYSGEPLDDIKEVLSSKIKIAWDKYQSEQSVFEKSGLDTLCIDLEKDVNKYILEG